MYNSWVKLCNLHWWPISSFSFTVQTVS